MFSNLALLLAGCPTLNPTIYDYIGGRAFLYNSTDQPVEVQISIFEGLDCSMLDHGGLAHSIQSTPSDTFSVMLAPEELATPWEENAVFDSGFFNANGCTASRLTFGGTTATVVLNGNQWHEVEVPVTPGALPRETVVIRDAEPRLSDGQVGFISDPTALTTCTQAGPTWSGASGTSTLLARRHHGSCEILEMSNSTEISVCDGPALPYLIGEDVTVHIDDTRFEASTDSGGKPYLLGRSNVHLPEWIELRRRTLDGTTELRGEGCVLESPCGAGLAADVNLRTTSFTTNLEWGADTQVTSPTGSQRTFTLYQAGVPLLSTCPAQGVFALTPRNATP